MSLPLNLLDIILIVVFLAYLVTGVVRGFFRSLGTVLGFLAGAATAYWAAPFVAAAVESPWRVVLTVLTVLVLLALGQYIGGLAGNTLADLTERTGLGVLDRIGGGVLNVAVTSLVIGLLGALVGQLGLPALSQQVAGSRVLRTLESLTPEPVRKTVTEARIAITGSQSIRQLDELLFPAQAAPTHDSAGSQAVQDAGQSVMQVYGTADECSQNQTGSGFVAAPEMVVTNAHVLAGVSEPMVQSRDGRAYPAAVVQYDAASDLAVLHAPGLPDPALPLSSKISTGEEVTFAGYPLGGPFTSRAATIQGQAVAPVQNVTTGEVQTRSIIQIAGNVEQGNSGGPLIDQNGSVVGVIFAKAVEGKAGYAIPVARVQEILDATGGSVQPVDTGQCSQAAA